MPLPRRAERERRYPVEITVELNLGRRRVRTVTDNVGANGLFARTDVAGQLRQLLSLSLDLPFGFGRLRAHGMVVHVVPPRAVGATPGMGIVLYGLDDARRDQWARFVATLQRQVAEVPSRAFAASIVDIPPPAPIRRRYESFAVVLEVRAALVQELVTMYTRDLARGSLLLQTPGAFVVGDGLVLRIVHPRRGDTLSVPCVVRRVVDDPSMRGIEVEFLDLDDGARALFWEFVGAQVDELEQLEVILVDE